MAQSFFFQMTKEVFHNSIIPTIGTTRHKRAFIERIVAFVLRQPVQFVQERYNYTVVVGTYHSLLTSPFPLASINIRVRQQYHALSASPTRI